MLLILLLSAGPQVSAGSLDKTAFTGKVREEMVSELKIIDLVFILFYFIFLLFSLIFIEK